MKKQATTPRKSTTKATKNAVVQSKATKKEKAPVNEETSNERPLFVNLNDSSQMLHVIEMFVKCIAKDEKIRTSFNMILEKYSNGTLTITTKKAKAKVK